MKETNLQTNLECLRTHMANKRTFMAFVRTALTLLIAGLTFIEFFRMTSMRVFGVVFIVCAAALFLAGWFNYKKTKEKIPA